MKLKLVNAQFVYSVHLSGAMDDQKIEIRTILVSWQCIRKIGREITLNKKMCVFLVNLMRFCRKFRNFEGAISMNVANIDVDETLGNEEKLRIHDFYSGQKLTPRRERNRLVSAFVDKVFKTDLYQRNGDNNP